MNNFSPNRSDSGYVDSSDVQTSSFQNGTPVNRKRKASCIENCKQNLSDFMDYCSPQFSSTLNGSFMYNFEKIDLNNDQEKDLLIESQSKKVSKIEDNRKFCSVPNTPEQHVKYSRDSITKKANTNSFIKNFSQFGMQSQSPLNKEAYEILYPELPSLECKKPATPLKTDKSCNNAKKRLFYIPRQDLLKKIISNNVIMDKILKDLSNGDLYRLAKVSNAFREAILSNYDASSRYLNYTKFYKDHKENYRITPPASPEKDSGSDTEVEASPGSKNFASFVHIAKSLNPNQSLIKCPKCQKPSVVENYIAQCLNDRCGYIVCKKCESFANSPRSFIDKCNNAQLLNTTEHRSLLGDLSNMTSGYMTDVSNILSSSSFNLNMSSKYDSSGTFSDYTKQISCVSTPKTKVKRNLSRSFMDNSEVFSASNTRIAPRPVKKFTRKTSLFPVIPLGTPKMSTDITEPPSPPKYQQHSACSKQSKRNLKRLTR